MLYVELCMIALFGGTFNPVHNGHVNLARKVLNAYSLHRVEFIPSYLPVHRDAPEISPQLRQQLIQLAIQPFPELSQNSCELDRKGPSYTIDTLHSLKSRDPSESLCWLMGADSFNSFASWKKPAEILQLAHLIVCARPGVEIDRTVFSAHFLRDDELLSDFMAGKIAFFRLTPNHCSSTLIRRQLQQGLSVDGCLAPPVLEFILQNKLYRN